ncbi:hypothetical protein J6590_092109 [Homalodisca vitripennis]|nr:hypothetical protein J6590_092109 [Homalodisca vitripennis]
MVISNLQWYLEEDVHSYKIIAAWKLEKNAPEARLLSAWGYRTSVDAFVVGRLGVDRRRDSALAQRYVSEAIKWSRDKYVEHITGVKQYTS